jgi:beta-galactosidase
LMIIYDPTPATWMWAWDNDLREDAPFAASLDLTYRYQPTTQDSGIGINADGSLFPFNGAPPPHNLFEARLRVVGAPLPSLRLAGHLWAGQAESTGSDGRLLTRFGADARATFRSFIFSGLAKVNDWGPYDYHRDFNLTFPLQLMADLSYSVGSPRWLGLAQTRLGVRGTTRYLDKYSPRFAPNPANPSQPGNEYEVRTYLVFTL